MHSLSRRGSKKVFSISEQDAFVWGFEATDTGRCERGTVEEGTAIAEHASDAEIPEPEHLRGFLLVTISRIELIEENRNPKIRVQ